jgi:hypothetical protein
VGGGDGGEREREGWNPKGIYSISPIFLLDDFKVLLNPVMVGKSVDPITGKVVRASLNALVAFFFPFLP